MNLIYVQQCLICCRFWRLWMVHGNKWTWELIVILFMLHCFLARFSFVLCPCFHALYVISLSSPHSLRLYDSFMAAHNPEKTDLWTTVIWMLVRCVSCLYPAFVAFRRSSGHVGSEYESITVRIDRRMVSDAWWPTRLCLLMSTITHIFLLLSYVPSQAVSSLDINFAFTDFLLVYTVIYSRLLMLTLWPVGTSH